MMWIIVEVVFAIINTVLIYLFVRAFLKEGKKSPNVLAFFVILAVCAAIFSASYFFNKNIVVISGVSVICAYIIGLTCFRTKIYAIGMAAAFSFLADASSELLAAFTITANREIPIDEVMYHNIYRLQGRVLGSLFLLAIIMLVGYFRIGKLSSTTVKLILAMCILSIGSILIVQQFTIHIVTISYIPRTNEAILLLSILIVNILIFVMVESLIRQNEKNKN